MAELSEPADCLDERSDLEPIKLPGIAIHWPLTLHAAYRIREVLTAVGWLTTDRRAPFQAGVPALPDCNAELLFVTLDKREGFSERIAYHDYAVSPERFHWQTQNSAGPDTRAGAVTSNPQPTAGVTSFSSVKRAIVPTARLARFFSNPGRVTGPFRSPGGLRFRCQSNCSDLTAS